MNGNFLTCVKCKANHTSKYLLCGKCRTVYCPTPVKGKPCGKPFFQNEPEWTECSKHRWNSKKRRKASSGYSEYGL